MRPGRLVGSRFLIERLAGTGGMGAVFRARDEQTGESVALKIAHGTSRDAEARFAREAAVLAELRHPGIVGYVAHGREPDGALYLAMEWIEGVELGALLAARRAGPPAGSGALDFSEAVALVQRLAEALGAAHARGIVHRDIKPANVLLVDGDLTRPKLLDFGVARLLEEGAVTRTGMVLGTPAYMAPEQVRGERDVDARADVFALGALLFECLTGLPPFFAEHPMGVLAKILLDEVPSLRDRRRDAPDELDALLRSMLAKDKSQRPAGAAALAAALGALDPAPLTRAPFTRAPSTLARAALTQGEQRILAVLLVAEDHEVARVPVETAPTVVSMPAPSMPFATVRDGEATAPTEMRLASSHDAGAVQAIVASHGGELERLGAGPLAVALRGAGVATDLAARAARCALALRAVRPHAAMALAMGRSAALPSTRAGGRAPFPAGQVIDRGVALLQATTRRSDGGANAARIRIDDVTAGLLDARFDVSGDADGLLLDGEREGSDTERTLLGKPTPCVGRERDLGVLVGVCDECRAAPMARAALVTAPAGVGKSRLARELVRKLRERQGEAPPEIWIARGDAISQGAPFGLAGQILRSAAGTLAGEPLLVRQRKLEARVGRHLAGDALAGTVAFLGEVAGAPFPSSPALDAARENARLMGDRIQAAWEDFLAAECAASPTVIVMDDLQWGDLPSLMLLDRALKNLEDRPLTVLAFARPDVHAVFPALWAGRALEEVKLGELSRPSAKRLVRAVLGDGPREEVVASIVERAAGNAFYLEELVRAVGEGAPLPETVLAMIEARLETLTPELRRVLRAGSVFGPVFWEAGAALLLGSDAVEIAPALADLERLELITRGADSAFRGTRERAFRQALVREATYATLTPEDRALGNGLAAEWLEASGEQDGLVLAEHFERGGSPSRAASGYARAAAHALDGNDLAACIERAKAAIRCGAEGEALGEARTLLAEALSWQGAYRASHDEALRAIQLFATGSRSWLRAVARAASSGARLGEHAELTRLARDVLALGHQGVRVRPSTWPELALMLGLNGHFDLSDALLADARTALGIDAEEAPSTTDMQALGHYHQAHAACIAARNDDFGGLLTALELAITAFDAAGDVRNASQARANAGFAAVELGAYEDAVVFLERCIVDAERVGVMNALLSAHQNLGLALSRLGRLAEAASQQTRALEGFARAGDVRMEVSSYVYLSEVERRRGALDASERLARGALALVRVDTTSEVMGLSALAWALLSQGRTLEAVEASGRAHAVAERVGAGGEGELSAYLCHAEALHASGDLEGARRVVATARARVEARISTFRNPEHGARYRARVPEAARILELAAAWA